MCARPHGFPLIYIYHGRLGLVSGRGLGIRMRHPHITLRIYRDAFYTIRYNVDNMIYTCTTSIRVKNPIVIQFSLNRRCTRVDYSFGVLRITI